MFRIASKLFLTVQLITLTSCVPVEFQITNVPKYYTPLDETIYIAGTFNGWATNSASYALTRSSFDTFYITLDLPQGTHEYKFTRGSWSNVETGPSGEYIPNRQLQVAGTTKITVQVDVKNWDDMKGAHTATGHVYWLESNFPYPQFARTKRMWIYLPPDYFTSTTKTYPVMYMHDGQNLFDKFFYSPGEWNVDEHLESLALLGFDTHIVVGVETKGIGLSGERLEELTPCVNNTYGGGKADLYLDFLLNNVKPYIDSRFRTNPDRLHTSIGGSSLGGLFSFYAGVKHQEVFGRTLVFSPSFWYCENFIFLFAADTPPKYDDFRVYMYGGGAEGRNMIPNIVLMDNQLRHAGYKHVRYQIDPYGEHTEYYWSIHFNEAYRYLHYEP